MIARIFTGIPKPVGQVKHRYFPKAILLSMGIWTQSAPPSDVGAAAPPVTWLSGGIVTVINKIGQGYG